MATADAIKTENKDFKVYAKLDAETGKIADTKSVSSESQFEAYNKNADYTLGIEQTVKLVKFGTLEGFLAAIPDAEAQLDIINRGTSQKSGQKIKEALTELTDDKDAFVFEPVDVLDVLPYLQEGPKRQKLSEIEKLIRQLKAMNLPDAVIQTMVAQAQAAQSESESEEVGEEVEA